MEELKIHFGETLNELELHLKLYDIFEAKKNVSDANIYKKSIEAYLENINEPTNWARKCDVTGEGMDKGYVVEEGNKYFKYEKDLINYLRQEYGAEEKFLSDAFILKEAYNNEEYYFTEWEEDFQYIEVNGVLTEIEE